MAERISIREIHKFQGKFPAVPTYPQVDEQALLINDSDPLYLNLPIAEIGRRSDNGILYDEALVSSIAEQLPGLGGGRGHIPEGQEDSAFPLEEVFWVGHLLDSNVLWAKGYVPPGRTREFIVRKKAIGGEIATSIFGKAIKEMDSQKRGFRLRDLVMEYVDLAPSKRASLKNQRGFELTKEMSEGDIMPDILSAADVPQNIREQIIKESQASVRVAELEAAKAQLETEVKEMREYASIVTTIRSILPANVDIAQAVTEMQNSFAAIRNVLGDNVNIVTTVEEMHRTIGEMRREQFTRGISDKVVEFTNWPVVKEDDKKRLAQIRASFQKRLESEAAGDATKIAEIATTVWTNEFQLVGEMFVTTLGGPAAVVGGKTPANNSPVDTLKSEAGVSAVLEKFGRK